MTADHVADWPGLALGPGSLGSKPKLGAIEHAPGNSAGGDVSVETAEAMQSKGQQA